TGWELNKLNNLVLRDSSWGSTSVEGRLSFWLVAWNMIKERPLSGFGLGTYHLAYNTFRNNDHYWSMFAHNHYLQLWAEAGIFALIGFSTFFLVFIIRSFNYRNTADKPENYFGIFAAILAFLLHLAVDFTWNMPPVTLLFWTLLGCQMALLSSGASAAQNTKWVKLFKYAAVTLALFLFFGSLQQMAGFKCAKIAVMQENNGQIQMAASWYERACKVFPWRAEYYSRYADLLYQQWHDGGQREILKKAIELKGKAISLSPYDYFNYQVLGKILWQEKIDGAEYYLQKAVTKAGFTPEPYNDLGYFYLANNKPEAAVAVFETGISKIPFAWKNAPGEKQREKIKMVEETMGIGLSQAYQELLNRNLILRKMDN
ncbi:MAG: O-antigen ligase family protein, partial [Desulfitobacteriaceae bacterium]|nr:O-antigen ligase family protein [Desulfitobacteriaceae bacterium]